MGTSVMFINNKVNGTSGESVSLTVDERKELARKWKTASTGRIPMILHIGTGNLKDTKTLARDAQEIGVEAIATVSPSYFRPRDEEAIVDYISKVTSSAPDIPMFYYSIDFMTNVYLNDVEVMRLGTESIPTLAGMKFTTSDLVSAFNCKQIDDKLQILVGTDTSPDFACDSPECTCVAPDCACDSPECTCVAPDCACDSPESTYVAPDCACDSPECTCVAPDCACDSPECTYVAPDCACDSPECTCVAPDYACDSPECTCVTPDCTCVLPDITCASPDITWMSPDCYCFSFDSTFIPPACVCASSVVVSLMFSGSS
ncbi:hypothetical protein FSP39_013335 [Pinctada imbricata]|uniref:N-acetylneuraminate lyase n=1 Tax=Pinctada imbricata TaxID=66713 RepID=A0AA89BQU7_PINIB|nr:hypothetical protein FSP39_013335 [Pinctada imbricata]